MCTAITLKDKSNNNYFGRTLDFSYELDPSIYFFPRNYTIQNAFNNKYINNKYSFLGIGQNVSKIIFTEGINEVGLAIAALYFPGFANYQSVYHTNITNKYSIFSLDIVIFLLGNATNINDVYLLLQNTNIIGEKDTLTNTIAPLHWIVTDKSGKCIVIESMADGMHILINPIGILTNSPYFEWHMLNLQNYINLSNTQKEESIWGNIQLKPFGQGSGLSCLPGDYTPPSRFVRASFFKTHIYPAANSKDALINFFHIAETVSIPKGIVLTNRNTSDYTQYTSFIDITNREYYFKTYNHMKIVSIKLTNSLMQSNRLIEFGKLSDYSKFKVLNI